MSEIESDTPACPERVRRLAQHVRERLGEDEGRHVPIGRYRADDGGEREVAIVCTATGEWEVRERGSARELLVGNHGGALEDAVALAIAHRRAGERLAVAERARQAARALKRRAASARG